MLYLLRSAQRSANGFAAAKTALAAAGVTPTVVTVSTTNTTLAPSDIENYILSEESRKTVLETPITQIKLEGATLDQLKDAGAIAAVPLERDHLSYLITQLGLDSRIVQGTNNAQNTTYPALGNVTSVTSVSDYLAQNTVEQLQHFSSMLSAKEREALENELKAILLKTLQKAKTAADGNSFTILEDRSGEFTPVTNRLIREIAEEQGMPFTTKSVNAAINELLVFPERLGTVVGTTGASGNFARLLAGISGGYGQVPVSYTNGTSQLHTAFEQQTGDHATALLLAAAAALRSNNNADVASKVEAAARK